MDLKSKPKLSGSGGGSEGEGVRVEGAPGKWPSVALTYSLLLLKGLSAHSLFGACLLKFYEW